MVLNSAQRTETVGIFKFFRGGQREVMILFASQGDPTTLSRQAIESINTCELFFYQITIT
jgi:hypothetical protein